jgi:hypothetical protein
MDGLIAGRRGVWIIIAISITAIFIRDHFDAGTDGGRVVTRAERELVFDYSAHNEFKWMLEDSFPTLSATFLCLVARTWEADLSL